MPASTDTSDSLQAYTGVFRGRAWAFGDWISGDDGIVKFSELRDFAADQDPARLAEMCFADLHPGFHRQVAKGDIVVGGRRFGVPSHPPVPLAIKACGIAAVVVESTDTGFVRKSLNVGLPVLGCPGITGVVETGHDIEVDLRAGTVTNHTTGQTIRTQGFSERMLAVLAAGGLVPYLERQVGLRPKETT